MIGTSLLAKAALGTVVACSGLTGAAAAHTTDFNKTTSVRVEAPAPVKTVQVQDWHKAPAKTIQEQDWHKASVKTVQVKQLVIVKSQDDCKKIALSHCAGTVKKVEKDGHNYNFTILGADHHEHVYQVNAQTGACAGR